ncbi:MAG: MBL fold metallo-hydrolase [Verrucomicrobiota bacterium]|nr:MBL fold metallo-hydrolase [Verrucomicrobiota bacterium]
MDNPFKITVVYDNHAPKNEALKPSWGFACVIEGFEKTILFDTGTSGPILMNNLAALGFDPAQIDRVVISHGDWDHIGGLWTFLDANPDVEVYLPDSLSRHLKDEVRNHGARSVSVGVDRIEICPGVMLSGEMKGPRNEQAVLLQTDDRQIVTTGCAHPGIVAITRRLAETAPSLPMLVMGGFHLKDSPAEEIEQIIQALENLGARWVAPTHCSGELAETLFAKRFGKHCLSLCPGSVIVPESLKVFSGVLIEMLDQDLSMPESHGH